MYRQIWMVHQESCRFDGSEVLLGSTVQDKLGIWSQSVVTLLDKVSQTSELRKMTGYVENKYVQILPLPPVTLQGTQFTASFYIIYLDFIISGWSLQFEHQTSQSNVQRGCL